MKISIADGGIQDEHPAYKFIIFIFQWLFFICRTGISHRNIFRVNESICHLPNSGSSSSTMMLIFVGCKRKADRNLSRGKETGMYQEEKRQI